MNCGIPIQWNHLQKAKTRQHGLEVLKWGARWVAGRQCLEGGGSDGSRIWELVIHTCSFYGSSSGVHLKSVHLSVCMLYVNKMLIFWKSSKITKILQTKQKPQNKTFKWHGCQTLKTHIPQMPVGLMLCSGRGLPTEERLSPDESSVSTVPGPQGRGTTSSSLLAHGPPLLSCQLFPNK